MGRIRGKQDRKPKRVILISCEGNNKTEKNYFSSFLKRDKDYNIKLARGNETDPLNLVKQTISYVKDNGLDLNEDDRAFCIFDTDINVAKNSQIKEAIELASNNKIMIITSSPCIELWFLLHFKYTTAYMKNNEVINELKTFYPRYEKNCNVYDLIVDKTGIAVKNAKKLEKNQIESGKVIKTVECNPHTDVYKIIEEITS